MTSGNAFSDKTPKKNFCVRTCQRRKWCEFDSTDPFRLSQNSVMFQLWQLAHVTISFCLSPTLSPTSRKGISSVRRTNHHGHENKEIEKSFLDHTKLKKLHDMKRTDGRRIPILFSFCFFIDFCWRLQIDLLFGRDVCNEKRIQNSWCRTANNHMLLTANDRRKRAGKEAGPIADCKGT